MVDYNNPHAPFPAPEISRTSSLCDLGCLERFTPKRLRNKPLFKTVNFLGCLQDNKWTDEELRNYLIVLDNFFRKSLHGDLKILNWYSLLSWIEVTESSWMNPASGNFGIDNDDFYSRYDLSSEEIWKSISSSNNEEFNEEGFKFYDWILKPYIGTNLIQKQLLKKLRIDAEIIDWYQNKGIENSYSFLMEDFPGWEKAKLLIINSRLLKNAESILISLRDSRCPTRLLLSDGGVLDRDYLSDISSLTFEGVHICFQRYNNEKFEINPGNMNIFREYLSLHSYLIGYSRSLELSEDLELDGVPERTVFVSKTNINPGLFVHMLPSYFGNLSDWQDGMTWEDYYNWGNINITHLVRTVLERSEILEEWRDDLSWGRWVDWIGVQNTSWQYNKPVSRLEYYQDSNPIPGFESNSGNSLYRPILFKQRTSILLTDVLATRSQIINYWNIFELSNNESISPNILQRPERERIVYEQRTSETE